MQKNTNERSWLWLLPTLLIGSAAPAVTQAKDGMGGADVNEISVPSDTRITREIRSALERDSSLSDEAKKVRIAAKDGNITLTGSVKTLSEKKKVAKIASRIAGKHKKVFNDTEISS